MDWENERWVRLYVRETTMFRLMAWEAQAILPHVLRLVDRAGVLELGGVEPADALVVHLPRWPEGVVRAGIAELIARGVIERRAGALVWPNYLAAQEAKQSDRQRSAESRARRRDVAMATIRGNSAQNETVAPHGVPVAAQNVTETSHGATRDETDNDKLSISNDSSVDGHEPDFAAFERVWAIYPKRAGGNPKRPAFEAWRGRLREGVSPDVLESAAMRYATFCQATGKAGTEYVLQAASFFGPKRRGWEDDWAPPRGNGNAAPAERKNANVVARQTCGCETVLCPDAPGGRKVVPCARHMERAVQEARGETR